MEIEPLTESDVPGYADLLIAAAALDDPSGPELTREGVAAGLRSPDESTRLVARRDGAVVGAGRILPAGLNTGMSVISVTVHPAHRRQGIGTALLDALDLGQVAVASVVKGSAGEHWALARGFRVSSSVVEQRLLVASADQSSWDVPTPAGYREERWTDATPDHLLASVVEGRFRGSQAEMVRGYEAVVRKNGGDPRVVAAVEEATGRVVALTDLLISPKLPAVARTTDVVAAPPDLSRFVKASVLRWLVAERPEVSLVEVKTLAGGSEANSSLGFVTTRELLTVSRSS